MNAELYKVLFGAQRQSFTLNRFLVDSIEQAAKSIMTDCDVASWRATDWVTFIDEFVTNMLAEESANIEFSPKCMLIFESLLGEEALDQIGMGARVKVNGISDSGKVTFCIVGESNSRPVDETKAWSIVDKIIDACPPSVRVGLPVDNALAAVLLSEAYWKGMR